jgi:hypothetical protein
MQLSTLTLTVGNRARGLGRPAEKGNPTPCPSLLGTLEGSEMPSKRPQGRGRGRPKLYGPAESATHAMRILRQNLNDDQVRELMMRVKRARAYAKLQEMGSSLPKKVVGLVRESRQRCAEAYNLLLDDPALLQILIEVLPGNPLKISEAHHQLTETLRTFEGLVWFADRFSGPKIRKISPAKPIALTDLLASVTGDLAWVTGSILATLSVSQGIENAPLTRAGLHPADAAGRAKERFDATRKRYDRQLTDVRMSRREPPRARLRFTVPN